MKRDSMSFIRKWFYRRGIHGFSRVFSNDGPSDHSWMVLACHPRDSITWTWAIYWTKPPLEASRRRYLLGWMLRLGFHMLRQDRMPYSTEPRDE